MSPLEQAVLRRKLEHLQELLALLSNEAHTPLQAFLDRKSTRLNSSHEWISRMPSSA